jgi:hypothetical protein
MLTRLEPQDSLRRRTVKLADDLDDFYRVRTKGYPPFSSADKNAPQELQTQQRYDQETQDLCKARFHERLQGIIEQLKGKELDIGMMDTIVQSQGCIQPWNGGNDAKQLRNLAHWLNADDSKESF